MKKYRIIGILISLLILSFPLEMAAQIKPIEEMTREDVLKISYDELINMPLDKLIKLAEIVGISLDELYEMILNKDVTIASKRQESTLEAPLSTTVITGDEIRKSGVTSIGEVFRLIPGFIVREQTPSNYDIHIRGNDNIPPGNLMLYSANISTLVMVNGRIIYNYLFGGTFWGTIPIDIIDIERIEVVRGPAAALYGPNAVTGVINIITKENVPEKLSVNADIQGGNLNTLIANVDVSKSFDEKFSMRFSGNYHSIDRFQNTSYFFPSTYRDYFTVDRLEDPNPDNFGIPIKPDTTAEGYYPDPFLSQNTLGLNAFLTFTPKDDINITLNTGMQQAEIISAMLDDSNIATSRQESISKYVQLKADAKGFSLNMSYNAGLIDPSVGSYGLRMDYATMSAGLEYQYDKIKNLVIRPGISFEQTMNDDSDYAAAQSLLLGRRELQYFAWSLRADYMMFDRLRLIGAVRQDSYNYPETPYLSYQAIGSFKINDNNFLRAVYSTSSNSSFILPTHTTYDWQKLPPNSLFPGYPGWLLRFDGSKDLDLTTTKMIEIGFRSRITKNVQLELEFFRHETSDFISFMPDSVYLLPNPANPYLILDTDPSTPTPDPVPYRTHLSYQNLDVTSVQLGVTAHIKIALSDKATVRLFGTLQKSELNDYYPFSTDQLITEMITDIVVTNYGPLLAGGTTPGPITYGTLPDKLVDVENESTPTFFGGFEVNYTPAPKLNINMNTYYYTSQKYKHKHGDFDIEAKTIINAKLMYNFWRENSIYFNVRNLIGNDSQEFGFLDKIGRKYLIGLNLKF